MISQSFIELSLKLDHSGLIWHPEIGDEVAPRPSLERVSILVDPLGLTPGELRETFLWLPTVEQLVNQLEARQALIYHAGVTEKLDYETVIKTSQGIIETTASTLRIAFGQALAELLQNSTSTSLH